MTNLDKNYLCNKIERIPTKSGNFSDKIRLQEFLPALETITKPLDNSCP